MKNAVRHGQTREGQLRDERAVCDWEERLQPLLLQMFAGVRRHRETPLLAGFDSAGIVRVALQRLSITDPQLERGPLQDLENVKAVFNLLVRRALIGELRPPTACLKTGRFESYDGLPRPSRPKQRCYSTASEGHRTSFETKPNAEICLPAKEPDKDFPALPRPQRNDHAPQPLAVWLEHFYTVMREVHPKAIDIIGLRLEGCKNREVAQRLGLSLRLVKRIVHDIQLAWESATETK